MKRALCLMFLFKLGSVYCSCTENVEYITQKQFMEVITELEVELKNASDIEDAHSVLTFFLNIVGCVLGVCCCCFIAQESCLTPDIDVNIPSEHNPIIQ